MKVVQRGPLRRQGISCLCQYAPTCIAIWVLPMYTAKMCKPCMERVIVLIIECALCRWFLRLSLSLVTRSQISRLSGGRCPRNWDFRNEAVVFMIALGIRPPETSIESIINTYYYPLLPIFTCQGCFDQAPVQFCGPKMFSAQRHDQENKCESISWQ